ncbi:MAG: Crp/Fnr family transcriptional regulator [Bacteroidaceae bacterium]|nr:Crp/Fnr family transcriptional regulator [Bacteroidaceae bacterium]
MYENLLRLPYFQGMSKDDITAILDKIKLEYRNYSDKEILCNKGDECNTFTLLTKGEITSYAESPDGTYSIIEEHQAPYAIEPYSMFGYQTTYNRSHSAKEGCTTLTIDKNYFFSEFSKHEIFTLNLMNLISRRAQLLNNAIWEYTPATIEGRIVSFIAMRCETTHGCKRVNIKMERLATILCETRLNVSRALNHMQSQGLVVLNRKEIYIPEFGKLLPLMK